MTGGNENRKADSCTIFRSWLEYTSRLKDDADRGRFWQRIISYAMDGDIPADDGTAGYAAFSLIKPSIDASQRRRAAGRIGGLASASAQKNNMTRAAAKEVKPTAKGKDAESFAALTPATFREQAKATNGGRLSEAELDRFCDYWTEPNPAGAPRFKLQKFFAMSRRIATWAARDGRRQPEKATGFVRMPD